MRAAPEYRSQPLNRSEPLCSETCAYLISCAVYGICIAAASAAPLGDTNIYRAGDMDCDTCGKPYSRHPPEMRPWVLASEDLATLRRLCNGDLVKL